MKNKISLCNHYIFTAGWNKHRMGKFAMMHGGQRADVINTREKSKWLLALTMHFVLFYCTICQYHEELRDSRRGETAAATENCANILSRGGRTGDYKSVRCWSLFLQQSVVHYDIIVLEFGLRADFITLRWKEQWTLSSVLPVKSWAYIFWEMGLIPIPDKPAAAWKCFVTSYPKWIFSQSIYCRQIPDPAGAAPDSHRRHQTLAEERRVSSPDFQPSHPSATHCCLVHGDIFYLSP